jgi:hypothetical protein
MKAEYKEGPEARENFEKLAKAVLPSGNPKKQPKKLVFLAHNRHFLGHRTGYSIS